MNPAHAHSWGRIGASWVLGVEQGISGMGESCLSPLPGQNGATWALGMEQGIHGMDESCLSTLPGAGISTEQGIHPKFKSVELQLVLPLPRPSHRCECHFATTATPPLPGLMPRLLWHIPRGSLASLAASPARGRSKEQEPTRSALMETWKTICR